MNIIVEVNFGKKKHFQIMLTPESPDDALQLEIQASFGVTEPMFQHYLRDKPMNINATELTNVLRKAVENGDLDGLQARLGNGCKVVHGDPTVTLFVVQKPAAVPVSATAPEKAKVEPKVMVETPSSCCACLVHTQPSQGAWHILRLFLFPYMP